MREMILSEGRRLDGRKTTDIRPITCEVGYLPRNHGSALFTRGETQSLDFYDSWYKIRPADNRRFAA